MIKAIAGVSVYLTMNPDEAEKIAESLHVCRNCRHYIPRTLFDGTCGGYFDSNIYCPTFNVDPDNVCECFQPEKVVDYWICKLFQMNMEYSGENDKIRAFFAQ